MAFTSDAQRLADAESKLHALKTGSLRVKIKDGEQEVSFTPANVSDLETYINDLRVKITPATAKRRRPGILRAYP